MTPINPSDFSDKLNYDRDAALDRLRGIEPKPVDPEEHKQFEEYYKKETEKLINPK
jgi:hypothetical protein